MRDGCATCKANARTYEAEQAAAEREREQAREEKQERMVNLRNALNVRSISYSPEGDVLTFDYHGRYYEVREAQREE